MASGWRGVASGALALVALELVVQPHASSMLGGLFAVPARFAESFLSPNVPTFKGICNKKSTQKSSASTDDAAAGGSTVINAGYATAGSASSASSGKQYSSVTAKTISI
jgi:hypothetical protein